jgi:hypothetical protein
LGHDRTDAIDALEQIVASLAACVDPLQTVYLEPYGEAEEHWRQARQDAVRRLAPAASRIRRWFATSLPPTFHLTAEEELTTAEEAIALFLACPIPQPALPIGWREDEDGKRHTPVGGSDPAHRAACQRLEQAASTVLEAVGRLTRWRDWETGDGDRLDKVHETSAPKNKGKGKRSTGRGDGRVKLIAALTKHHEYANGGCINLAPIGNKNSRDVRK